MPSVLKLVRCTSLAARLQWQAWRVYIELRPDKLTTASVRQECSGNLFLQRTHTLCCAHGIIET